jgi:hypothetical protein
MGKETAVSIFAVLYRDLQWQWQSRNASGSRFSVSGTRFEPRVSRMWSNEYRRSFSVKSATNRGCCYCHVTVEWLEVVPWVTELRFWRRRNCLRFLTRARNFSFHCVETSFQIHVSWTLGTGGSFIFFGGGIKLDRTYDNYNRTFYCRGQERVELYLRLLTRLHNLLFNYSTGTSVTLNHHCCCCS